MRTHENPTLLELSFAMLLPVADRRESPSAWDYYFGEKLGARMEVKDGKPDGKFQVFYSNGVVAFEGHFKQGERSGSTRYFRQDGSVWEDSLRASDLH